MAVSVYTGASSSDIVYVNYTGDTPTKDNITNMTEVVQAYNAGKVIAIKAIPNKTSSFDDEVPFFLGGVTNNNGAFYIFEFVAASIASATGQTEAISCPSCIKIECSQTQTDSGFIYTVSSVTNYGFAKAFPAAHADTHKKGGDDPIVPSDIGAQSKITANGILKGDGTGTITAADETEVELVDLPIRAESIIIPKSRMRGDIKGTGKVGTVNDLTSSQYYGTTTDPANPDSWACDVNGDGWINSTDIGIIASGQLYSTPLIADYYNNWTYHKVDNKSGYWTTEISIAGLNTSNNVVVNICETFSMGQFYKAEVSTGKVKIYATTPPITDIPAIVVISSGSGKGSIPSYLNESSLDHKFSLNLPTASWTGSDPYTQTVTITGSTANTKVDIQPSEKLYDKLVADNVGYLAIKNVDGTLTAVAKGGKPSVDLTVQVTYNNVYE